VDWRCAVKGQLDLFTGAAVTVPAPVIANPGVEVAGVRYSRSVALGHCGDCERDQHTAYMRGHHIPFRRRATYLRKATGEPDVALCEAHKDDRAPADGAR